jgi:hypothetical protein
MASGQAATPVKVTLGLDSARAKEFLDKLAHDDSFRRELADNPDAVLRRYDITIDTPHQRAVKIPPKGLMKQIYDDMFNPPPNPPWFGPKGFGIIGVALAITE